METFGKVIVGVHGKELPKFSYNPLTKEYWKLGTLYNDNPKVKSRVKLVASKKYWAKPDKMLLSSLDDVELPIDPFKTIHVTKVKEDADREKPDLFDEETLRDNKKKAKVRLKWISELKGNTVQKYDAYNNMPSLIKKEREPLYSSFAKNKVFVDPLTKIKQRKY